MKLRTAFSCLGLIATVSFPVNAGTVSTISLPGSTCDAVKGWAKFDDGGMYSSNGAERIGINCSIPNYFGAGVTPGRDVKEVIQVRVIVDDQSSTENIDCTLWSSNKTRSANVRQTLSTSGTGVTELTFAKPATQYASGYMHLLCNIPKLPAGLKPSGVIQYQVDYNQL